MTPAKLPRHEFETTLRIHLRALPDNTSHVVFKVVKLNEIVTYNQPWTLDAAGRPDIGATREALIAQIMADCYPPEPTEPAEVQQQPAPVPAAGDIWADVLLDARHNRTVTPELLGLMAARRQQGIARYGVPVQIGNQRDARFDAIQEALDAIVYCECRRQQLAPTDPTGALGWSYAREDAERLAQRMLDLP